ncbi:MAG: hypothetical protein JWL69_2382 [Phycisphaerales bacterium]|nr:hypothetical protein [Phycisphaerales bacterium]
MHILLFRAEDPPLSPAVVLGIGIVLIALGCTKLILGISPSKRAAELRATIRWGHGAKAPSITRLGAILCGASIAIMGCSMIASEYLHRLGKHDATRIALWAAGIWLVGAIGDSIYHWAKGGFRILERCPHCRGPVDFRIVGSTCPFCRKPLAL